MQYSKGLFAVGILQHTDVYIVPLVDMCVLPTPATYLLPLCDLFVLLLLRGGLLLGDTLDGALLDEGWTHAVPVAPQLSLPALEILHDLVEVELVAPVVDGDAVRADADVSVPLAAAEQFARVHVALRAQPGACDVKK